MIDPPGRPGDHVEVLGLASLGPEAGRLLVAVGVFDGLHRGHLYLLRHLRSEARRLRARPAVVTFDAHPDEILLGAAPPILCDPDERLVRLARAGVAVTIVQHFDDALRRTPFESFVGMIRDRTELAGFLMTPDAAFGHERRGTPAALAELGARVGFEVTVVPPLELDGRQVRSSEIRAAIVSGDLSVARRLLGRRVAVVGDRAPGREGTIARFGLPVALPPPGAYPVTIEPAWAPTAPPATWRWRAVAVVLPGPSGPEVAIRTRREPPSADRLRIAF